MKPLARLITTITVALMLNSNANAQTVCVDSSLIDTNAFCTLIWNPVCGCNCVTYSNACIGINYGGLTFWTMGSCPTIIPKFGYSVAGMTVTFSDSSIGATGWLYQFGDGDSAAKASPVHTYTTGGTYYVCLTIEDSSVSCSITYCDSVQIIMTGDQQLEIAETHNVRVYPNPASDYFNVYFTLKKPTEVQLKLYDLAGRLVLSPVQRVFSDPNNDYSIPVGGLDNGYYFLKVKIGEEVITRRMVVAR